jgi:hypothetical protein
MKKLLLYALPLGLIISLLTIFNSNSYSQQSSSVKTTISSKQTSGQDSAKNLELDTDEDSEDYEDTDENDVYIASSSKQVSSSDSNMQRNSLSISSANLKQPHILKINSPNGKVQGEIKINGKVVKRFNQNKLELNLSPYLSRGQQKVEVSGRYNPATASVTLEMKSSGNEISQQDSGSGILNYVLDLNVQ